MRVEQLEGQREDLSLQLQRASAATAELERLRDEAEQHEARSRALTGERDELRARLDALDPELAAAREELSAVGGDRSKLEELSRRVLEAEVRAV
jgi:hypothetical protein